MNQTSLLVRLSSLLVSLFLITPNAIPAARIRSGTAQQTQTAATGSLTLQATLAALVGNVTVTDVTLTGSVRRIVGSDDESGTATLKALPTGSARADLSLSSGPSSEIQNLSAATPGGEWSGPDGIAHSIA